MVKFQAHQIHLLQKWLGYLEGVLASSSHCSILIEISLANQVSQENDLNIAPIATTDYKEF
jgi:hypothetical protein